MDQVMDPRARENEKLDRIVAAAHRGVIVVDSRGGITWIDDRTRRRVNGGLQNLSLPLPRSAQSAIDCFMAPVEVRINGELRELCLIQQTAEVNETESERDLIATIQAVMADTSWLTRTLIEKLKALRQSNRPNETSNGVRTLSEREREVLGLICEGVGDAEMSATLGLSPNTVRNHIASLYRKIGVNRRSAAIIWARERGITSLDVVAVRKRVTFTDAGNGHSIK